MMSQIWLLILVGLLAASCFWVIMPLLEDSRKDEELPLAADHAVRLDLEDARIQLEDDRLMDRVPDEEYQEQRKRIKDKMKLVSEQDES